MAQVLINGGVELSVLGGCQGKLGQRQALNQSAPTWRSASEHFNTHMSD